MPDLDGLAATAQLKRDARTAAIPVVMLSAKMSAADRVDALAAGVNDFAAKPFRSVDVLEKVRFQIGERHATLLAAPPPGRAAGGGALDLDELIASAGAAAERAEHASAAAAYSLAAEAAADIGDPDQANKFLRLAGKMHICEAEASSDPAAVHDAYRAAARYFLAAGNLALATRANASARAALAGPARA
jgi:CheY-like chemotaxis protein